MEFRRVLIVDDEENLRHMLSVLLRRNGYRPAAAPGGVEALELCARERFDMVLCDIRMPSMDGIVFLEQALQRGVACPVIMMSAYGTLETAIDCMKRGAYDYISKPFNRDEILLVLKKVEERERLKLENRRLREELASRDGCEAIVTRSDSMRTVLEQIRKVAGFRTSVLITGESGTGKELAARAIHALSGRCGPFVPLNCGAIPETLLESELFGHVKGAFTDAHRDREGVFEMADGGTLFLDEVGEMSPALQVKLLRAIQEGEVRRVGSASSRTVDVRILSATSRDLPLEAARGRFREDLLYRLNAFGVALPPLRERGEDIALLATHFLRRQCERIGRLPLALSEGALTALCRYRWPGNVRELENCMEHGLVMCGTGTLEEGDLPEQVRGGAPRGETLPEECYSLKKAEREAILKALEKTGGNRTHAARILEISLRGLLYKLKDYGIGDT